MATAALGFERGGDEGEASGEIQGLGVELGLGHGPGAPTCSRWGSLMPTTTRPCRRGRRDARHASVREHRKGTVRGWAVLGVLVGWVGCLAQGVGRGIGSGFFLLGFFLVSPLFFC